jgi:hypothetical protein
MNATQNAIVVIGDSISTSSLNSDHVRQLGEVSKATGFPVSGMLDRAIDTFLNVEAPVYLERATRNA